MAASDIMVTVKLPDDYVRGLADGMEAAVRVYEQDDTPTYTARIIDHHSVVRCEWHGAHAELWIPSWVGDQWNFPESMLAEIGQRLLYECFRAWMKGKGYL